jgi:hypothetical protein
MFGASDGTGSIRDRHQQASPPSLSPLARRHIEGAIKAIVRGFGLRTTALLVQLMVDGGDVQVIELAPRVGGGLNFRLIRLHTGVDIVDLAVDAFLDRKFEISAWPDDGFLAANYVYATAGTFGEVRNHERLLADGVVDEFYVHKLRGARMGASLASSKRVCSFSSAPTAPARCCGGRAKRSNGSTSSTRTVAASCGGIRT